MGRQQLLCCGDTSNSSLSLFIHCNSHHLFPWKRQIPSTGEQPACNVIAEAKPSYWQSTHPNPRLGEGVPATAPAINPLTNAFRMKAHEPGAITAVAPVLFAGRADPKTNLRAALGLEAPAPATKPMTNAAGNAR